MNTSTASVSPTTDSPIRFETHPDSYKHWNFQVDGNVARLGMSIQEDGGLRPGYPLKLNSYDLGVDIELADAIRRLRFEHPQVRVVVFDSDLPKVFCSGANIFMLGASAHAFKVNFCKFTNETRLYIEEMSNDCGIHTLAALSGACAGGGYELALACDEIILIDDGNTAVSLPEVPLLGVLPGTGGLTRVVDKRKVRRDLADVFSTVAEGVKGKRAKEWRLVDEVAPSSRFEEVVKARIAELETNELPRGRADDSSGVVFEPLNGTYEDDSVTHKYVSMQVKGRTATLRFKGPEGPAPTSAAAARALGGDLYHLRLARELEDIILDLRFNRLEVGTLVFECEGDAELILAHDEFLLANMNEDWFIYEAVAYWRRTLKRVDITSRSVFSLIEPGHGFHGSLFELTIAGDRSYMLDDRELLEGDAKPNAVRLGGMNFGPLPMANGLTRLETRFLGDPDLLAKAKENHGPYEAVAAQDAGLVTLAPDDIDWEDEVRIAIEERASYSPDALTGMEANLRFAGPETLETKIFGRLSAWQNWIFQRPNAVGEKGALTLYSQPERPQFDWRRT